MIQNVVRDMGGMAAFGIISICLFFVVFAAALIWACAQRKSLCDRMCMLPLEDGSTESAEESFHE